MSQPFYKVAEDYASKKLGRTVRIVNCSPGLTLTSLKETGLVGEIVSIETASGPVDIFLPFSLSEEKVAA